jgi:excinuclease ABC subunit A
MKRPEGVEDGGRVVATGTPEEVAANDKSFTGIYLRTHLPQFARRVAQPAASGGY